MKIPGDQQETFRRSLSVLHQAQDLISLVLEAEFSFTEGRNQTSTLASREVAEGSELHMITSHEQMEHQHCSIHASQSSINSLITSLMRAWLIRHTAGVLQEDGFLDRYLS